MAKYEQIPTEEDLVTRPPANESRQRLKRWLPWICHILLFSISLTLFLASIRERRLLAMTESFRESQTSSTGVYSPAESAIEHTTFNYNGSINFKTVYKGTPRKELDDAWDALSPGSILPGPTLSISEEELKLIGKDSMAEFTAQIPPEHGGGYFATLEVFHQLHCLNLVRMATYKEHYDLENAFEGDVWLRDHIGVWVNHYRKPYPDFSTRHQCRNFNKIKEWAEEHSLNVSMAEMVATRGHFNLAEPPA